MPHKALSKARLAISTAAKIPSRPRGKPSIPTNSYSVRPLLMHTFI